MGKPLRMKLANVQMGIKRRGSGGKTSKRGKGKKIGL